MLKANWKQLLLFILLVLVAPVFAVDEVNLYSARKEALIKPLLDRFSAETGIKVNLVTGKADALIQRLRSEGHNTPADLLITTDVGRLHRAKAMGLLQSIQSDLLSQAIPGVYRDPGNMWFGLSLRARTLVYSHSRVKPDELSSYEDLTNARWKNRICIRSSDNIYNQSLLASMIVAVGEELTQRWANGLVSNFARPPRGGDRDQIKAVAAGQCDIAIINTYYLGNMIHAVDAVQRQAAAEVKVFWPNQNGRGVHVNVSGAGVTAHAKNRKNAIRLLEFMSTVESQQWYAQVNYEYPVQSDVEISETLKQFGLFKPDSINLSLLGEKNAQAVMIMDRAGWQ